MDMVLNFTNEEREIGSFNFDEEKKVRNGRLVDSYPIRVISLCACFDLFGDVSVL